MGRRHLQPETYGRAATDWDEQFFKIRVYNESDRERLRAVIKHEAERDDPRRDRIATVNKRIQTLKENHE